MEHNPKKLRSRRPLAGFLHSVAIEIRGTMQGGNSGDELPVILQHRARDGYPGLLRLILRTAAGKRFGRQEVHLGDVVHFDVGGVKFGARVASKRRGAAAVRVHAFDVMTALVRPVMAAQEFEDHQTARRLGRDDRRVQATRQHRQSPTRIRRAPASVNLAGKGKNRRPHE
jgi:hypothetical protein